MLEQIATIQNKLGLHARSASVFVKTASGFSSSIKVSNEYANANGKSIMSMMLLQAACGTEIVLQVDGEDEKEALEALLQLVNNRFGEDE